VLVDYRQVAARAEKIIADQGILRPPVDPEQIAAQVGLEVVYAEFPDELREIVSGYIEPEHKRIVVNRDTSGARQIFTIAHELGHYILHRAYTESPDYRIMLRRNTYADEKPEEEREADAFAAHLLVPDAMLKRYRDIATVRELARAFGVSEDVIRNRLNH
jgi:Zn-dependent peptidase ImmA (M78 family)